MRRLRSVFVVLVVCSLVIGFAFFVTARKAQAADYRSYADTGAAKLRSMFNSNSGLWDQLCSGDISPCWWQSANQLTTLLDYHRHQGSNDYSDIIATVYNNNQGRYLGGFRNTFIDDTGWWGLAWVEAYDQTGDSRYLNTAAQDADYMASFWDPSSCNGGVWWSTDREYKNAIANELYIKLEAAVYNRNHDSAYRDRAIQGWNWFVNSGMINSSNLVNDGLDINGGNPSQCTNNGHETWTYNQGVVLGAAAELDIATANGSYIDRANDIAYATMHSLVHGNTGALRENACESTGCDNDQSLFKGIFIRNLSQMEAKRGNGDFQAFIRLNADTIWGNDRNNDQFGLYWSGGFDRNDPNRQSSALDALVAAMPYSTSGSSGGSSGTNLAQGRSYVTDTNACAGSESAGNALDGNNSTKWCEAGDSDHWMNVDLGSTHNLTSFTVRHAGSGGENSAWNTRAYTIQVSTNGTNWNVVVNETSNTQDVHTYSISPTNARWISLNITNPTNSTDYRAVRIYELQAFGT